MKRFVYGSINDFTEFDFEGTLDDFFVSDLWDGMPIELQDSDGWELMRVNSWEDIPEEWMNRKILSVGFSKYWEISLL